MSEQQFGAGTYLQGVKSHLSDMVKGRVFLQENDIVIETSELGAFHTTFDVWEKMLCGIPSKDTAEIILKQYKHFILNKMFRI